MDQNLEELVTADIEEGWVMPPEVACQFKKILESKLSEMIETSPGEN